MSDLMTKLAGKYHLYKLRSNLDWTFHGYGEVHSRQTPNNVDLWSARPGETSPGAWPTDAGAPRTIKPIAAGRWDIDSSCVYVDDLRRESLITVSPQQNWFVNAAPVGDAIFWFKRP